MSRTDEGGATGARNAYGGTSEQRDDGPEGEAAGRILRPLLPVFRKPGSKESGFFRSCLGVSGAGPGARAALSSPQFTARPWTGLAPRHSWRCCERAARTPGPSSYLPRLYEPI